MLMIHHADRRIKRVAGLTLQKIRARWFAMKPFCVGPDCVKSGFPKLATQLDHIVPLFKGGADNDSNRQGLCDECHAKKTATDLEYSFVPKVKIGADGWPEICDE